MAYTEIKQRNSRKYYYRVLSVRKGERVQKNRIYLGVDLTKNDLQNKEIEASKNLSALDIERTAKKNTLRKSEISKIKGITVKGYDFNNKYDYNKIIESLSTSGFQATHLGKAIDITNQMIQEKSFIFLGYTSNMVSSGNRDIIRFLTEHKKINVLITTTGGIEEDIIKCLGNFVLGDFKASGEQLRKKGINRIGNIFVPNDRYIDFEKFLQPILEELYQEQKKTGIPVTPLKIIYKMGEKINNPSSIYYQAQKNKIPVYCPCITDGAIGDNVYFFKFKHPDFILDVSEDVKWFNDTTVGLKKSGAIILGSGIIKHAILNANMLRNGLDYAVYINTAQEFDGSDAGALPEEAISWGKILPNAKNIKVFADATIVFPLLVSETFARK
ncbi:MAG: deoxyhypusine synthase [archaeon]|nr:deoxyhypusine synthase [archaeon]